ncbi:hypothetical protein OQA88_12577 [Cercophora sp. LCS_1]
MTKPTIFIIGGTGAQGIPVIRGLVHDGHYAVRVLTRDPNSPRAQHLTTLGPSVTLLRGSFTSESDIRTGLAGCYGAFINIDGFATGEAMETHWTIRCYELAVEAGISIYVHGNLDFVYKLSGYNPAHRCGHYDAKGRMAEWILGQGGEMKKAAFTTGPYMEMAVAAGTPMQPYVERDEDGEEVCVWRVPLGEKGAVPHVALDDCAVYARWLFDNPERANGLDLQVAIAHLGYKEVADAFSRVTGRKAKFVNVTFDEYWGSGHWKPIGDYPTGYMVDVDSPAKMTMRDNFTGFWRAWQASGDNKGLVKRDYELMDEIHPGRIRSAEEWFRKEEEKAKADGRGSLWEAVKNPRPILKIHEDQSVRKARKLGKI